MDAMQKARLSAAGIDVEDALNRLMGSEVLLKRLLGKFLEDTNYEKLEAAMASQDQKGAIAASHTLKGVCGNLSMTALYALFVRQVEAMRGGDWDAASAMMEEIRTAYEKVAQAIREMERL